MEEHLPCENVGLPTDIAKRLRHSQWKERQDAVEAAVTLAERALAKRELAERPEVVEPLRCAAAMAVAAAAHGDGSCWVREAAVRATPRLVGSTAGSETLAAAVKSVVAALADEDYWVRESAVATLPLLVESTSLYRGTAVAAAASWLDSDAWQTQLAAVNAIARVALQGDHEAIALVCGQLQHTECAVREAALRALLRIAPFGDPTVLAAIGGMLGDQEWLVREAALQVFGELAEVGDADAMAAVASLEEDEDWYVRQAASVALARLARPAVDTATALLPPVSPPVLSWIAVD